MIGFQKEGGKEEGEGGREGEREGRRCVRKWRGICIHRGGRKEGGREGGSSRVGEGERVGGEGEGRVYSRCLREGANNRT